ncbi:signal peptidase I [Bacillus sp. FJAT-47783]|uniref:signal peptidase I SipW n=1 Tax=Bacillus sp. FJAT-47783 TaxID=2922712 RepID=UPI001FAE6886|nr:signal peptidase I [Bacillus sp. FJAT-47783]
MKQIRNSKIYKITSNILFTMIFCLLLLLTITVISSRASGGEPELFGYQIKAVLSGSMEPTFLTGSLIIVEKLDDATTIQKGDVITFKKNENELVTHRIVDEVKTGTAISYVTKGDNVEGQDPQPVLAENVVAKYTGITIPYAGYFLSFASSNVGTGLLLIIPGIMLLVYSAFTIWQVIKDIERKTNSNNEASL